MLYRSTYRNLAVAALLFLGFKGELAAQDSIASRYDFSYVQQSEVWLTSANASGLQHLPIQRIALVEAFANKSNGDFVNYFESNNSYELGAQTESYFRLNPQVVFYGKVSFSSFTGKNMGGSVFINPYYNPFDIVEMADTTRGTKNLEQYHLVGAISVTPISRLSLGAKVDYKAANYAKHKDLRHVNKLLDLTATLGASYSIGNFADVGANYYYRRSVEGMSFNTYGTTDKSYTSLISFGAFYGRSELFGESGYTTKDFNTPMFNEFQGGAAQLNLRFGKYLSLFNEFFYAKRSGYYGKKYMNSPIHCEFSGAEMKYNGTLSFAPRNQLHTLAASVTNEEVDNFENIYQKNTTPGGKTEYIYYGNTQVSNKKAFTASIEYTANLGVENFHPTWVFNLGAYMQSRKQLAIQYPYYRRQTLSYTTAYLQAARNFVCNKNEYGISLGARYGTGSGTPKNDGTYITPSSTQGAPKSSDSNLYREFEYLTTNMLSYNILLKYARLFTTQVQGYIKAGYEYRHAEKTEYLPGNTWGNATLRIGCTF